MFILSKHSCNKYFTSLSRILLTSSWYCEELSVETVSRWRCFFQVSIYKSIYLSVCLSVSRSVGPSIRWSVSLFTLHCIVLYCIVIYTQVVATVDDKNPLDQVVPPRGDGLNHDLAAYINSKTSKLALLQNGKQVNVTFFSNIVYILLISYISFM